MESMRFYVIASIHFGPTAAISPNSRRLLSAPSSRGLIDRRTGVQGVRLRHARAVCRAVRRFRAVRHAVMHFPEDVAIA